MGRPRKDENEKKTTHHTSMRKDLKQRLKEETDNPSALIECLLDDYFKRKDKKE